MTLEEVWMTRARPDRVSVNPGAGRWSPGQSAALLIAAIASTPVAAAEILVLSGGAPQSPLNAALPAFEARSGHKVNIAFAPAGEIARRVGAGEVFDLLVMPDENVD